jgi:hypothetical protein
MGFERTSIAVALALCALGALACSKSSLTEPGTSSITLTVSVVNAAGQSTVETAQAVMDGTLFIQTSSPTPLSTLTLIGSEPLAAGNHTLTVVITAQSASPTSYIVTPSVEVFNSGGTLVNTVVPVAQTVSLATGAGATFTFSF